MIDVLVSEEEAKRIEADEDGANDSELLDRLLEDCPDDVMNELEFECDDIHVCRPKGGG